MREITKFRAWDNTKLKWIDVRECSYTDLFEDEKYIVQQWTGLYDENNKPIFEGDIVEHEYPEQPRYSRKGYENPNLPDNMSVIRWSRENEDNHPGFRIYDLIGQGGKIKVVGNIFENSELLKK